MLLVTALDLFEFDALTVSDWALREGIVLDAVRTHDPDDWSDDPARSAAPRSPNLARRCNSDEEHTAHVDAARAAALRRDAVAARARP